MMLGYRAKYKEFKTYDEQNRAMYFAGKMTIASITLLVSMFIDELVYTNLKIIIVSILVAIGFILIKNIEYLPIWVEED